MFLYLWLKHDHEAPCKLLCFISYRLFPGETLTMMRVTVMPFTVDDLEAAGHDGSYAERINCALSGREWGKMMCNLTLSSPILTRSLLFIWLKSSCYYQTLYASELSVRTGKAKVCTAPFFPCWIFNQWWNLSAIHYTVNFLFCTHKVCEYAQIQIRFCFKVRNNREIHLPLPAAQLHDSRVSLSSLSHKCSVKEQNIFSNSITRHALPPDSTAYLKDAVCVCVHMRTHSSSMLISHCSLLKGLHPRLHGTPHRRCAVLPQASWIFIFCHAYSHGPLGYGSPTVVIVSYTTHTSK